MGSALAQSCDLIYDNDHDANDSYMAESEEGWGLSDSARRVESLCRIQWNGYRLRGVEVSLDGRLERRNGKLMLSAQANRTGVELTPLIATDKVQWDAATGEGQPPRTEESEAYERLAAEARDRPDKPQLTVTGPLEQMDSRYRLEVRLFA